MVNAWPNNPTQEAVADALYKGLGRAYVWARDGKLDAETLLAACRHDYRYDTQVEEPRGDWLWELLRAALLTDRLGGELLAALNRRDGSRADAQLCQLARHFARDGDAGFRDRLRQFVAEKPVEDRPWIGERDLILLDGAAGFILAARRHGADLASQAWDWYDRALCDDAVELLGKEQVDATLKAAAAGDADVRRFYDEWLQERHSERDSTRPSYHERLAQIAVDDIIAAAEQSDASTIPLRGWGRMADEADLAIIYRRLVEADNVDAIRRYLTVFSARPWPRFDRRLLELCVHADANVRRRAVTALSNNRHPDVRRFALEKLDDPAYQEFTVKLLVKNYEVGDERRIVDSLVLPDDADVLHWTLMSLLHVLDENPTAECSRAGMLVYAETPCSGCRHRIVKLLIDRGALSQETQAECRFDVDRDTRLLVGGPAWDD